MYATYCSVASLFMPSSSTPVTFSFRNRRTGAPCAAALSGNAVFSDMGTGVLRVETVVTRGVELGCGVGAAGKLVAAGVAAVEA